MGKISGLPTRHAEHILVSRNNDLDYCSVKIIFLQKGGNVNGKDPTGFTHIAGLLPLPGYCLGCGKTGPMDILARKTGAHGSGTIPPCSSKLPPLAGKHSRFRMPSHSPKHRYRMLKGNRSIQFPIIDALNPGTQLLQFLLYPLVPAIDMIDPQDFRLAFRCQRCQHQGRTGSQIGTHHGGAF